MKSGEPQPPGICPKCGKPLPGLGLDAICPSCLLSGLDDGEPDDGTADPDDPGGDDPADDRPPRGSANLIAGHEIIEEIDSGGMGVVYKVREPVTGRVAALKMLQPRPGTQAEMRGRFRIEAMALASLDDPGILPLYRFGEDRGRLYFTMRYAGGGSLAVRMRDGRAPATPREAAELVSRIARAVGSAHTHGILHRDLKPGNILFDDDGNPQVADFGLARITGMDADLTKSGGLFGTPMYMAPEAVQKGSRHATTRSDVYSLGAILYQLLAGQAPFHDPEVSVLLLQITGPDRPEPPSRIPGGMERQIPRDLETVCLKALEKEPSRRYQSTLDFDADLQRWMNGYPIQARPVSVAGRLWRWTQRNPALAVAIALLACSLAAAGILQAAALRETRAREREALAARRDADGLIRNMTTTHADLLEPLGRLDVLDAGFAEVERYYAALPPGQRDEASRSNEALFLLRWADGLWQEGKMEAAAVNAKRALRIASSLAGHDALLRTVRAHRTLGVIRMREGNPEEAAEHLRTAMTAAEPGAAADPALAGEFAAAAAELGRLEGFAGRIREAIVAFRRGRSVLSSHLERTSGTRSAPIVLRDADCLMFEGMLHQEAGGKSARAGNRQDATEQLERSLACFREAQRSLRRLSASAPANMVWLREANLTGEPIARSLRELGPEHFGEAADELRRTEAVAGQLATHNLTNLRWQADLAGIRRSIARLYEDRFRHESTGGVQNAELAVAAADAARLSLEGMAAVVLRDNRPQWVAALGEAIEIGANLLPHLPADALERSAPAFVQGALTYVDRSDPASRSAAIRAASGLARAAVNRCGRLGRLDLARTFWSQWTAEIHRRSKDERSADSGFWLAAEATLHRAFTDAGAEAGQPLEGLEAAVRAAEIRSALLRAGELPDTGAACHAIAIVADLQADAGDFDAVLATARASLDLPAAIRRIDPPAKPGWRTAWIRLYADAADRLFRPETGMRDQAADLAAAAAVALDASDLNLTGEERAALDALRARTEPGYVVSPVASPSP